MIKSIFYLPFAFYLFIFGTTINAIPSSSAQANGNISGLEEPGASSARRRLQFVIQEPRLEYGCPEEDFVRLSCSVHYVSDVTPNLTLPDSNDVTSWGSNYQNGPITFDPDIFVIWFKDGQILDAGDPAHQRTMPDRLIFKSASGRNDRLIIRSVVQNDEGHYRCLVIATNSTMDPSYLYIRSLLGEAPQTPEEEDIVNSARPVILDRNFTISVLSLKYFEGDFEPIVSPDLLISAKEGRSLQSSGLKGPPKFIESESWSHREIVKPAGTRAVIRCPSVGTPKPTITWLKNGYAFTSDPPRVKRKKWFLIIEDLMIYDKANYTCVVNNEYGSINATFLLDVVEIYPHRPLIIPGYPQNLTVHLGQKAEFKCPLFVDMEAAIHWLKGYSVNGSERDYDGVLYSHVIQASQDQQDPSVLTILNVTRNDAGHYYCSASNSIGTSESSAWLKVLDKPLPIAENAALNASFTWDQPKDYLSNANRFGKIRGAKEWYKIIACIMALVIIIFAIAIILFFHRIRVLKKLRPFKLPFGSTTIIAENPFYYHRKVTLETKDGVFGEDENGGIRAPIVKIQYVPNEMKLVRKIKEQKQKSECSGPSEVCSKLLTENSEEMGTGIDKVTEVIVKQCKEGHMWTDLEMVHDPLWEIPRDYIEIGKQVGEGAFGCVAEAVLMYIEKQGSDQYTNSSIEMNIKEKSLEKREMLKKTVAVKMLKDNASDRELADLISELELMKIIGHHGNIINLIGCCTSPGGPIYVIVEMAELGNLRDFLRKTRPPSGYEIPSKTLKTLKNNRLTGSENVLTECYHYPLEKSASSSPNQSPEIGKRINHENLTTKDLLNFAHQISQGMEYLSSKKCVHRDLAARNILLTSEYVIKIADFGLARDLASQEYYKKNTDGRLPVKWMAPESLFYRKYTLKSDVWSFGIVLWEIATLGGTPYPSLPVEKLFDFLKSGQRLQCPQNCPQELYNLMAKCWHEKPEKRPTFVQTSEDLEKLILQTLNVEYLDLGISLDTPSICSSTDKQFTFQQVASANPIKSLNPIPYAQIIQGSSTMSFPKNLPPASSTTPAYYNSEIFNNMKSTQV